MNIDELYEIADEVQKLNKHEKYGEILDAEVTGLTMKVTYQFGGEKSYTLSESDIDKIM